MTGQPQPAARELQALAAKVRPDWHPDDIREALAAAHFAAMPWGQVLTVMGRLMADENASPDELAHEAPKPWRTPPPGDYARGAALARAALQSTTDITDTTPEGEPR